jgi:hypothetical protein
MKTGEHNMVERAVIAICLALAVSSADAQPHPQGPTGRERAAELQTSKKKVEALLNGVGKDSETLPVERLRKEHAELRIEMEKLLRVVDRRASLCARVAGERP